MDEKEKRRRWAAILLLLDDGSRRINRVIRNYHSRLYRFGVNAGAEIGGTGTIMDSAEVAERAEVIVTGQTDYATRWIREDLRDNIKKSLDEEAWRRVKGFQQRKVMRQSFFRDRYRAKRYAMQSHSTAHRGMADEMIHQSAEISVLDGVPVRIEAIFTAYPEEEVIETSCSGCPSAVAGNPYTPETVPIPGDFPCMFNCRHEILYRMVPATTPA